MNINDAVLDLVFRGFQAKYTTAYLAAPTHGDKIAMTVPSSSREETYGWLGAFPNMREWIGPRHVKNLEAHGFTIKNRKFESTVEVTPPGGKRPAALNEAEAAICEQLGLKPEQLATG